MRLQHITQQLGITYQGENPNISGINTLQDAGGNELSFLDNKKYLKQLAHTQAAAVFIQPQYASRLPASVQALVCEEPYVAMARASALFAPPMFEEQGKDAVIGKNCQIQPGVFLGKNTRIGDHCRIMAGCHIGANVTTRNHVQLYPNCVIYRDCIIGNDCIIHAGAIIGADGFGFAMAQNGEYVKIYQNGHVVIGNNVEIGANTTIDRAAFGATIIEDQARIDNLVQVAHNCVVGEASVIAAQTGLSGSTPPGKRVIMAGQTASTGHLHIASGSMLAGRAVATKTVKEAGHYAGYPLMPHRQWMKLKTRIRKLLQS